MKKKSMSPTIKVQQDEKVLINHDAPQKDDNKLVKDELKIDTLSTDIPIIEPIETNVPKEKDLITKVDEAEINNSNNLTSELLKTDSPLEDSDSLKRLRMYMQTMKKSPEPPSIPQLELKNDTDIRAINPNQSKIKMSDRLVFIIRFVVISK